MAITVGVLGCSKFAERAMIPALLDADGIKLKYIASRNYDRAKKFAKKFDCQPLSNYEELIKLENVDLVYIPLPTYVQYKWVKQALLNNKHVLVEKSFLGNYRQVIELIDLARERNLFILENFLFLRHKQTSFIKKTIQEHLIGDIKLIRSSFCFPPLDNNDIRYKKDLVGGAFLDAGTYPIKCISQFINVDSYDDIKLDYNDDQKSDVKITGSLSATINKSIFIQAYFSFNSFYQCSLEILGTRGKIEANRIFTAPPAYSAEVLLTNSDESTTYSFIDNQYLNQWIYVKNFINKNISYETVYNEIMMHSKLLSFFTDSRQHG